MLDPYQPTCTKSSDRCVFQTLTLTSFWTIGDEERCLTRRWYIEVSFWMYLITPFLAYFIKKLAYLT